MIGWQDYAMLYAGEAHTVVGTLKVRQNVYSPQLDNRRDILVYLPPSYARQAVHYPVIYMQVVSRSSVVRDGDTG